MIIGRIDFPANRSSEGRPELCPGATDASLSAENRFHGWSWRKMMDFKTFFPDVENDVGGMIGYCL